MSHDQPMEQTPQWAQVLLDKVLQLENDVQELRQQPDPMPMETGSPTTVEPNNSNSHVEIRPQASDLHPYPALRQALPALADDFFRSPLDDIDRRRFLLHLPRNVDMVYEAPLLNDVPVGASTRQADNQWSDLQYRLSGLTRPIDSFAHELLCLDSETVSVAKVLHYLNTSRELLADVATFATHVRTTNMYKAAGINVKSPLAHNSQQSTLVDDKELVAQAQLASAVRSTSAIHSSSKARKHRQRSTNQKLPSMPSSTTYPEYPASSGKADNRNDNIAHQKSQGNHGRDFHSRQQHGRRPPRPSQ